MIVPFLDNCGGGFRNEAQLDFSIDLFLSFAESSSGGGGIHYEYEHGRKAGSLSPLMRQESAQL